MTASRRKIGLVVIVILFVALAVLVILHEVLPPRIEAAQNACINNLRAIDEGKKQWALAQKNLQPAAEITTNAVDPFVPGGFPNCPAGGVYAIGRIAEKPRCSVPGHSL